MTDMSSIDYSTLYAEGCHTLRHYSEAVKTVRTLAIAQGFVILTGVGYLLQQGALVISLCLALFGLLFTWGLFMLQRNYWLQFDAVLAYVVDLESRASEDQGCAGPWQAYAAPRNRRFARKSYRVAVMYGPYLLLALALIGLSSYGLATWRN